MMKSKSIKMKYLLTILLLSAASCKSDTPKISRLRKPVPRHFDRIDGIGIDSSESGYAAHAIYIPIAISDSGVFWTDSIPPDGDGVWRPRSLPFQFRTSHYRVIIEKMDDPDLDGRDMMMGPYKPVPDTLISTK